MLKNTFLHMPGIGVITESRLWESGILSWNDFFKNTPLPLSQTRRNYLTNYLQESRLHLQNDNPRYFSDLLPSNQLWRLFSEFRHSTAYLDIETTGLDSWGNEITTIALYDGQSIFSYVNGQNLEDFAEDIKRYRVIVSYNGKTFDVPFIESYLGISLEHAHIDLRYVLAGLGYRGGLKGCERQLGMDREELADIDGFFAVLLWNDYVRNNNPKALETLLAYNIQDTITLERLMVIAYNLNLKDKPFYQTHQLELPDYPEILFKADRKTVDRIKSGMYGGMY
ncbi:MAG: ribonuclease H-like domain-containing protein [Deltaproteobacteria bacterium]|nr:ribonuclease H-like domain-containing protein [Deltaproteobacteria bacterium]